MMNAPNGEMLKGDRMIRQDSFYRVGRHGILQLCVGLASTVVTAVFMTGCDQSDDASNTALANQVGVNLSEAAQRYANGCPRCESIPCTCE